MLVVASIGTRLTGDQVVPVLWEVWTSTMSLLQNAVRKGQSAQAIHTADFTAEKGQRTSIGVMVEALGL